MTDIIANTSARQIVLDCSGSMACRKDFMTLVDELLATGIPVYGFSQDFWRIQTATDAQRQPTASNPDIAFAHVVQHSHPVVLVTDGDLMGFHPNMSIPSNVTVVTV